MNIAITFSPMLGQIFDHDFPLTLLESLVKFFSASFAFLFLAGCIGGLIFLIHFLFTLPMRRAERARLFLDLLESALQRGQSLEAMILSIAQSRDRTLGVSRRTVSRLWLKTCGCAASTVLIASS